MYKHLKRKIDFIETGYIRILKILLADTKKYEIIMGYNCKYYRVNMYVILKGI